MSASSAREPLEAIMLVGGKGTRLRPLTLSVPKPLLPTAGVPFLAHMLARAAECGVTRVVLATSYRSEMFAECFGDEAFGLEMDYVHEEEPLGTGGGIRNAAARLRGAPDDPVVVLNSDVLSGHDLPAQLDLHRKADAAVTLHLVEVDDPARFGCVPTDDTGRVTAFLEKAPHPVTNQINAGCYVFARRTIDEIPPGQVLSVERETFPALIESGQTVMGYVDNAYFLDVGTPESFVRGSCDLVLGHLSSPALTGRTQAGALLLPGCVVDESATIDGGSTVGTGTVVGPGAVVTGSVLFDGVTVAARAQIRDSVLGRGVKVDSDTVLDGVVVGDGASIAAGNELRAGVRVWPGVELGPVSIRFSTDA
ncbi:MAG TPA: NDP-sugar synthase [Streptosporangiaceae bacterium]|jgi:mannose-1-phosphate guanylyltransferase|nr:NDP-sugar synthase [Streptosporangiaceae bacterium]